MYVRCVRRFSRKHMLLHGNQSPQAHHFDDPGVRHEQVRALEIAVDQRRRALVEKTHALGAVEEELRCVKGQERTDEYRYMRVYVCNSRPWQISKISIRTALFTRTLMRFANGSSSSVMLWLCRIPSSVPRLINSTTMNGTPPLLTPPP
jgi:hypothetical protein